MPKRKTKEEFIRDAISVHGSKYSYDNVEYINNKEKVCIICPEHGEFWMSPNSHLSGQGCPKCGVKKRSSKSKMTLDKFINKSNEIHHFKYDYSKVNYVNSRTKVCIICPEHGEFFQMPHSHLRGVECPKCAHRSFRYSNDEFIEKSRKIHEDKYDYSKVNYKNNKEKVCIICPEHGEFWMSPNSHLSGQGCPKCARNSVRGKLSLSIEEFIQKANEVHNNKYDYSECGEYVNNRVKLKIICHVKNKNNREHGEFYQTPHDHLQGYGCPKCGNSISMCEDEIYSYVHNDLKFSDAEKRCRNIIDGMEIDIYIPSKKIGIEYNGLMWHSEKYGKDKFYHLTKTEKCRKNGIKLIQIFEDEYNSNKELILSKIRHILKCDDNIKVYGRNCTVKEISVSVSKKFLNENHIQGFANSSIYLGCFYNNKVVSVMTFLKTNNGEWELNRFATDKFYRCIGVGGKLFSYFIKTYHPENVKSFADRRWTLDEDNNLYTKLGFHLTGVLLPDYRYVCGNKRKHKFGFRKKRLLSKYADIGLTEDMTEKEMCDRLSFYRIWDCGLLKYEWFNNF